MSPGTAAGIACAVWIPIGLLLVLYFVKLRWINNHKYPSKQFFSPNREILLFFFFVKKSFFIEDESLRGRKINLIGRFEGHDDLYFQQNKLKDNFFRQRKSRKWIQHKFSEKMDENLTSTYSYQGIAPKIPWNRPLSKFKVKFRSDWGHPKVILSKLKTFVMRKISQFGLTIRRDLETVFIWRYLVIYQQYYLPLPPYIFSQNQATVFIIPKLPGSWIMNDWPRNRSVVLGENSK